MYNVQSIGLIIITPLSILSRKAIIMENKYLCQISLFFVIFKKSNYVLIDVPHIKNSHHIFPLYAQEFLKSSIQDLEEKDATIFHKARIASSTLHKHKRTMIRNSASHNNKKQICILENKLNTFSQ